MANFSLATADFFPWIGTHPEDALSENSIRTGYYDKLSIMPSDSGLAKPHIWPSIKHKSGLVLLS
jgi:mediator of RNA polymerase II transcription subunit 12